MRITVVALMAISLFGCPRAPYSTQELLDASSRSLVRAVQVGSNEEIKAQVQRFVDLFVKYDREEMKRELPKLYAQDAFLNDRIHSVKGLKNIVSYFDNTFEKISSASFDVQDVAYGNSDVYLRWVMLIYTKKDEEPMRFLGCSQLRFNVEGKIIYHQDHWDFSELLGEVTLIRSIVNYAKSKS